MKAKEGWLKRITSTIVGLAAFIGAITTLLFAFGKIPMHTMPPAKSFHVHLDLLGSTMGP